MNAPSTTVPTLEQELDRLRDNLDGLKTTAELMADAARLTQEVKDGNAALLHRYDQLLTQTKGTYEGAIERARTALTDHLTQHQEGWATQLVAAEAAVHQIEQQIATVQERQEKLLVSDLAGETAILSGDVRHLNGEVRQMQQQHEQKLKELTNLLHRAHEGVQGVREKLDHLLADSGSRQDSLRTSIAETSKQLTALAADVTRLGQQLSGLPTEKTVSRLLDERVKASREERTEVLTQLQADVLRLTDEQTASRLDASVQDLKAHFDQQQEAVGKTLAAFQQQFAEQQQRDTRRLWLLAFIGLAALAAAVGSCVNHHW